MSQHRLVFHWPTHLCLTLSPRAHMCQCLSHASDVSCSSLIGGHHQARPTPASLAASPAPHWLSPVTWPYHGITLVHSIPGPASSHLPLVEDITQDPPLVLQDIVHSHYSIRYYDYYDLFLLFVKFSLYGMIMKAIKIRSLPDVLYVLQFLAPVCDGEPQPHLHALHQTWPIRGQNHSELTNQ